MNACCRASAGQFRFVRVEVEPTFGSHNVHQFQYENILFLG